MWVFLSTCRLRLSNDNDGQILNKNKSICITLYQTRTHAYTEHRKPHVHSIYKKTTTTTSITHAHAHSERTTTDSLIKWGPLWGTGKKMHDQKPVKALIHTHKLESGLHGVKWTTTTDCDRKPRNRRTERQIMDDRSTTVSYRRQTEQKPQFVLLQKGHRLKGH